jgi:ribosomal protein S18 acetylase RimI-like enzyme
VILLVNQVEIEQLNSIQEQIDNLSELLIQVVEDGASIGFLPPLKLFEAQNYWQHVLNPEVILFSAKINNQIVGSVQLHLCFKKNGEHRVEIAKLMTHPSYRRKGIGRLLMKSAEEKAIIAGKTLVVLDTREGDPSNSLYKSIGYVQAGRIPNYAKSANGELHATIYYYKNLNI